MTYFQPEKAKDLQCTDPPLKAVVWGHSQLDHDGFYVSNWSSFEVHCQQLIEDFGMGMLLSSLMGGTQVWDYGWQGREGGREECNAQDHSPCLHASTCIIDLPHIAIIW